MILQPVDWHEHDVNGVYVIDVFGRLADKTVACVRLTGFKPYFYVSERPDTTAVYEAANKMWVKCGSRWCMSKGIYENAAPTCKQVKKYDTMAGFEDMKYANVWAVECETLATFKAAKSVLKGV